MYYREGIMRKNIMALLCCIFMFTACTKAEVSKAPDFSLKDLKGSTVKLSDYAGKVVILNFWATWCPPCKTELPDFVKFYDSNCNNGIEIIGIAVGSKPEEVKKMAEEYKITYPLCISDGKVESLYGGVRFVPTTVIIDRKGNIKMKKTGALSEEELKKIVKGL
jgi:peroxiredoxin